MIIKDYDAKYNQQVIDLILGIQTGENATGLTLENQPDLNDIEGYFVEDGSNFWVALDGDEVVGTIALKKANGRYGILKKFFVSSRCRGQKVGLRLYEALLGYAGEHGIEILILDTPASATQSHAFYAKAGFYQIEQGDIPFAYSFPHKDSLLFQKDL